MSDIYLPGMLYAVTLRSPVACGTLEGIECPRLHDGYRLLKAADIPGENRLAGSDLPVLAPGRVSYIGEPVAILAGPDRGVLEKLALECRVIVLEEKPVFTIEEAEAAFSDAGVPAADTKAILAQREIKTGDPDAAFTAAASTLSCSYETGIQEHWCSETCAAIAWLEAAEPREASVPDSGEPVQATENVGAGKESRSVSRLVVRTATDWPSHTASGIAMLLGSGTPDVQVRPATTGSHLGSKLWYPSLVACHAALCVHATGRPVRLVLSRGEDFFYSPKRFASRITITSAFDEKGDLTATDVNAALNLGAGGIGAQEMLDQTCLGSMGIYSAKNVRFKGTAYRTNIPPQGAFSGFGLAQGLFACERHTAFVADGHRTDPAVWRRENFIKGAYLTPGLPIQAKMRWEELCLAAMDMSDYRRKWAACELLRQKRKGGIAAGVMQDMENPRGIGIAMGWQGSGLLHPAEDFGCCEVDITLERDGSLEIKTSGGVFAKDWAQIAFDVLGIEAGNVRVKAGGDDSGEDLPAEGGSSGMSSRACVLASLVEEACLAIREQRFRNPLPISVSKKTQPVQDKKWDSCFSVPEGGPADCGGFQSPGAAAAVVEVEIDLVEYLPKIRGVWLAVDGGSVFRRESAISTLRLSTLQAIGWAGSEYVSYIDGKIPKEQFDAFAIYGSGSAEMPDITVNFLEDEDGERRQQKGIGSLAFSCVPAAYLQAVSQAAGRHFSRMPLLRHDIRQEGGEDKNVDGGV